MEYIPRNVPARISKRRSVWSVKEIKWADKPGLFQVLSHQQVQFLARFRWDALGLGDKGS